MVTLTSVWCFPISVGQYSMLNGCHSLLLSGSYIIYGWLHAPKDASNTLVDVQNISSGWENTLNGENDNLNGEELLLHGEKETVMGQYMKQFDYCSIVNSKFGIAFGINVILWSLCTELHCFFVHTIQHLN